MPLPIPRLPSNPTYLNAASKPRRGSATAKPYGSSSAGAGEREGDSGVQDEVDIPDFSVPAWRTVLNSRQDLGESALWVMSRWFSVSN
jgi:hypothetical protein